MENKKENALLSFAKSMGWLNALVSQGHLL